MFIISANKKLKTLWLQNRKDLLTKTKATGIYLLVPVINLSVSVFTTPVFAKNLTVEEFGYLGFYTSVAGFFGILYGLSFNSYYMSVYYRHNEAQRKKILTTLTIFSLGWNLIFFPASYFGVYFYFLLSKSSVPFFPFALLTLGGGAIGIYKVFVQIDYKLQNQPIKYLIYVAGYRVLSTLMSVYVMIYLSTGLMGRMLGAMAIELLFFIVTLTKILRGNKLRIDKTEIKVALRFIAPLLPGALLFLPLGSYDNIVLERLNEPANMGLYNLGKSIAYYLYLSLFSCFQVFEPDIYKNIAERNLPALKRILVLLSFIIMGGVIAFWMISPWLINFLTAGRYIHAIRYANIWALTNGLVICFSIFDAMILALQESKKSLVINIFAAGLCLVLYTAMGSYYKQEGVAFAAAFTYLCLLIMQSVFIFRIMRKQVTPVRLQE